MNDYIDRYIAEVVRRLPLESKSEVSAELKSNILDMLPENPTDYEIEKVLYKLGHPRKIALNYDKPRYVVAPELYQDYKTVLRIVLITLGIITLFLSALSALLSISNLNLWDATWFVISEVINGIQIVLLFGFTVVTIGYWIASRDDVIEKTRSWDVKRLPKPDANGYEVKRSKAITSLVAQTITTTIFIAILLFYLERIGWYDNGGLVAPLFGVNIIEPYIPFFIVSELLTISGLVLLIIQGHYKLSMVIIRTIGSVLSVLLTIMLINTPGFISQLFINRLSSQTGNTPSDMSNILNTLFIVISIIVVIVYIGDTIVHWLKLYKSKNLD